MSKLKFWCSPVLMLGLNVVWHLQFTHKNDASQCSSHLQRAVQLTLSQGLPPHAISVAAILSYLIGVAAIKTRLPPHAIQLVWQQSCLTSLVWQQSKHDFHPMQLVWQQSKNDSISHAITTPALGYPDLGSSYLLKRKLTALFHSSRHAASSRIIMLPKIKGCYSILNNMLCLPTTF